MASILSRPQWVNVWRQLQKIKMKIIHEIWFFSSITEIWSLTCKENVYERVYHLVESISPMSFHPNWVKQIQFVTDKEINFLPTRLSHVSMVMGSPGAVCLTKTYDVTIPRYRKSQRKITVSKMHILWCMGSKFCVKFQRCPLKFHTRFWTPKVPFEISHKILNPLTAKYAFLRGVQYFDNSQYLKSYNILSLIEMGPCSLSRIDVMWSVKTGSQWHSHLSWVSARKT